jgi:hypothetical protein
VGSLPLADEALALALVDCLEATRRDDDAVARTLELYPDLRSELEELLRIVDLIPKLPADFTADPDFANRTRSWLAAQAARFSEAGLDPDLA